MVVVFIVIVFVVFDWQETGKPKVFPFMFQFQWCTIEFCRCHHVPTNTLEPPFVDRLLQGWNQLWFCIKNAFLWLLFVRNYSKIGNGGKIEQKKETKTKKVCSLKQIKWVHKLNWLIHILRVATLLSVCAHKYSFFYSFSYPLSTITLCLLGWLSTVFDVYLSYAHRIKCH